MPPTHGELLAASNQINARISASQNPPVKDVDVTVPPKPEDLTHTDEDVDPFNGNLNNRRVAERIANTPGGVKQFLNNSLPTHIGDPNKAAADVAKSKSITPDPPKEIRDHVAQAPTKAELEKQAKEVANRKKSPAALEPPSIGVATPPAAKASKETTGAATSTSAETPEWKPQG